MFDERDKIEGDLDVVRDTRLYGLVTGNVTVKRGKKLVVHGMISGSLFLEETACAHIYGSVFGDVIDHGSELRVWSTGTIRGTIDRGSGTKIEAGAKVRALSAGDSRRSPVPDSTELKGFRVLVVEDDDATRDEIVGFLRSCSAEAISASEGEEGFEVFRRERPDAIVADLWMPKLDGYSLIKRVRSLPFEEGGLTPAVAMTASTSDAQEKALMSGFHAYLAKPFDPFMFVELLRSFHDANETNRPNEPAARWTLTKAPGKWLLLTFAGHVRAVDVRKSIGAVALHLAQAPATVVIDARHVSGFDASVGSVAERAVWQQRRRIERVILVSSERSARLVAAAACLVVGVTCDAMDELPPEMMNEPN